MSASSSGVMQGFQDQVFCLTLSPCFSTRGQWYTINRAHYSGYGVANLDKKAVGGGGRKDLMQYLHVMIMAATSYPHFWSFAEVNGFFFQIQIRSSNLVSKSNGNPKTKSCFNTDSYHCCYSRPTSNPTEIFKDKNSLEINSS